MLAIKALLNSVDDTSAIQLVKVLADEVLDYVERLQPYGLATVPPKDAETLLICTNGDRDQAVAVVIDDANSRPTGQATADVVLYSAHGQKISFDSSQNIKTTQNIFQVGDGNDFAAMAAKVDSIITKLDTVFRLWSVTAQDGGAALKANYLSQFPTAPSSVASTNLKAD